MEKIDNFVDFDAKVDKFLRHQMTEDEENLFKSELDSDQEKRERARTIALMIRTMQQEGLKHDQVIIDDIREMNEIQFIKAVGLSPKKINLRSYFFRHLVAASVAIVFFLGGYQYYGHNQIVTLGNNYYSTYTLDYAETMHIRGIEDETKLQILATVFDKVRDNIDIDYTIKELEILYNESFVEGSVYYDYQDDIAWNLAIAYLKDGNCKKPIPILEGIIKRNSDYPQITEPVQDLLEKIRDL